MLEKKKFVNYTLEEDKDKNSFILAVRINKEEKELIKAIKQELNINSDSKALKISARVGLNVLQATFTPKVLTYLCSEKRERLSDYKGYIKPN